MSGKDLLAVLVMIIPGLLLIVLIAISLLPPANFEEAPGYEPDARKGAHSQTGAEKARIASDPSARARRDIAAQDMISDFWGRPYCANCVQVSEATIMEKDHEARDASMHAKSQIATQKRMRDPWEKPDYAKTSSASPAPQCDPEKIEQVGRCLYW